MALPNLTRDQAAERAALVTVDSYRIALDLTDANGKPSERTFRSVTTVEFEALAGADTYIDLAAERVRSAVLNGVDIDVSGYDESTGIPLKGLAAHNTLVVDADCLYSNTGEGLHRFVDPVDDEVYLYTQFEVPDSRRMYPVFEQPDLKASFTLTVTAPSHWQVIGNSPTPEPTPVEGQKGAATWAFAPTERMSSYITALVAGPYDVVRDSVTTRAGEVPLGIFCRRSLSAHLDADHLFDLTKAGFAFFEEEFDEPYAFGKYDQLFVPEFNAADDDAARLRVVIDQVASLTEGRLERLEPA